MQYLQNQVVQCQKQVQEQQAVYHQQQQPQYFQQPQQQQAIQAAQQNSQFFMPAKQLNLRNEFQKLKPDTLQFNPQQLNPQNPDKLEQRQRMPLYPSENDMKQFKNSFDSPKMVSPYRKYEW